MVIRSVTALFNQKSIVFTLLLLALAVRIIGLGDWSFWYDEGYSVALATKGIPAAIAQTTIHEANTPLYLILLNGWGQLTGQSEFASRFLSVAASLVILALVMRMMAKKRAVLWVGVLLALSPLDISLAQESRMYELLATFCVASILVLQRYFHRPTSTHVLRILLLWNILCLAAFATHVLGAFSYLAQVIVILVELIRNYSKPIIQPKNIKIIGLILLPGIVIAAYLLLIRIYINQYDAVLPGWLSLADIGQSGLASLLLPNLKPDNLKAIAAISVALILLMSLAFCKENRRVTAYVCLSLTIVCVFGAITGKFRSRYVTFIAPLFLLCLTNLLMSISYRHVRVALAGLLILLSGFGFVSWRTQPIYRFDDFRGAVTFIRSHIAKDEMLLLSEGYFNPIVEHYLGKDPQINWMAIPNDPVLKVSHTADYESAAPLLNQALRQKSGVWLLLPPENVTDPSRILISLLRRQSIAFSPIQTIDSFQGVRIMHFRFNDNTYLPTPDSLSALIASGASKVDLNSRPYKGLNALGCWLPHPIQSGSSGFEVICFWRLDAQAELPYSTQVSLRIQNDKNQIVHQQDQQLAPEGLPANSYQKPIMAVYHITIQNPLTNTSHTLELVAYTAEGEIAPHIQMPFQVSGN